MLIRPAHRLQALKWWLTAFFGLIALVLVVLFAAGVSSHTGLALVFLVLAVVCAGLIRLFWWLFQERGPALTVKVDDEALTMLRHGQAVDTIEHGRVGLVLIEQAGPGGVTGFRLYGPDRIELGRWDTNWMGKSPLRAMRALDRYGYPWVLHDLITVAGPVTRKSKSAPAWAEEVAR